MSLTYFTLQSRKLPEPTNWKVGQVVHVSGFDLLLCSLIFSSSSFPLNSQRNSAYLPSTHKNLTFLLVSLLNLLSNISLTVYNI